jgi:hypothetical protein
VAALRLIRLGRVRIGGHAVQHADDARGRGSRGELQLLLRAPCMPN